MDVTALPVDNSIEYNPTASRSVYHYQVSGEFSARRGAHQLKAGFLSDQQKRRRILPVGPASQLAHERSGGSGPEPRARRRNANRCGRATTSLM